MRRRYILAPEAALDLVQVWRYIKNNASLETADLVESVIREKIVYLAGSPGAGHWRRDLTEEPVKFFSIYAYLIVYRPLSCRNNVQRLGRKVSKQFPIEESSAERTLLL